MIRDINKHTVRDGELREWEHVEMERSTVEASRTDLARLLGHEKDIARYLNPPCDTCYSLEYAFHLLGDVRGKSVLELGCGSGENSLFLARRGARVLLFDISAHLLEVAKQRLSVNGITQGVTFLNASAYDMPLADESVDLVFGIGILHHLKLPLVAREVKRVLRKSGRAIFKEPIRNSKFVRRVRRLIPYQAPDVSPFERPLTDEELEQFADGFTLGRRKAFELPYIGVASKLSFVRDYIAPLYNADNAILDRFHSLRYYATIRVIEMTKE